MSFDHLAPWYPALERLSAGDLLQRARVAFLGELAGCRRILSVGEGHGRFAQACLSRFPLAELSCVEASAGMREQASRRLGAAGQRVIWHAADVRTAKLDGPYDALVTCFFLDCFTPSGLDEVVDLLAAAASPSAVWLVADFSLPPQRGITRLRARTAHALMYAFFALTTSLSARRLTPPDAALERNGFRRVGREHFDWGLLQADCWRRGPGPITDRGDAGTDQPKHEGGAPQAPQPT